VWYEVHATMASAIAREKAIKKWKRAWKIALIKKSNPHWRDLHEELG
jgi:putative endonuclease